MSTMLAWSITAAQVLLGLAMSCAAFRILWGPRAQDRVVRFGTLSVNAMLLLLVFGIRSGSTLYFEGALVVGLLGFVSQRETLWRRHSRRAAAGAPGYTGLFVVGENRTGHRHITAGA